MYSVQDFTPEWLSAAIGVPVIAASVDSVVSGSSTKVLMRVEYGRETDLPTAICVKGPFEGQGGWGNDESWAIEANFFSRIAPMLSIPLPRSLYGEGDVTILEDLRQKEVTFGDPLEPWSPDLVAAALEIQASWHRQTWGSTEGPLGELTVGASAVRGAAHILFGADHWDSTFSSGEAPDLPRALRDRTRLLAGYAKLWERDEVGPHVLAHGDPHIGNLYVDDGRPVFFDWQGVCRAPSFYDMAYFVCGALTVADRRQHERDLVAHYLEALGAGGGPRITFDTGWADFRRYAFHGIIWAVTPPVMQTPDRVRAMAERYAAAITDHASLELLGV